MQRQFNSLSVLINNKIPEDTLDYLKYTLRSYSVYLKSFGLEVNVEIKIQTCVACSKQFDIRNRADIIQLNCEHKVCSAQCLQQLVRDSTGGDLEEYLYTFCSKCMNIVSSDIVIAAFGGREEFTQIRRKEDRRAPKFECPMCYEPKRIDESVTLSCNHRFCKECTEAHMKQQLGEIRVSQNAMACPECNKLISINISRALLSKEEFKRLDDFMFETYSPEDKDTIFFRCIRENCGFSSILPINTKKVKCNTCKIYFCVICRDEFHGEVTCEQNYDAKTDKSLLQLAEAQGWKQCPHCKNMCERTKGCNFMKCMSQDCKGLKNFCYLCGHAIAGYSHFLIEGPFGKVCNTMDGNAD